MGILIAVTISTLIYIASAKDFVNVQTSSVTYDIGDARRLFNLFVDEYNKQYDNDEEYELRYTIFVKNLEEINKRNKRSKSAIHGITEFVDLTEEEFLAKYTGLLYDEGGIIFINESIAVDELMTRDDAPDDFDWRQEGVVTGIKNQGQCNSCWAFGAVGVAESQYAIKHSTLLSLSEQQLLDCWSESGGCETGNIPHRGLNAVADMGGFMQSSDYPYKTRTGTCMFDKSKVAVKVMGGYTVTVGDEEELKRLVHQYGPLSLGIHAGHFFSTYTGSIFIPSAEECPEGAPGNHAVVVVGYGTENSVPYWIIKNSYGARWGEQGYMRLIRGKNACSLLQYIAGAKVE